MRKYVVPMVIAGLLFGGLWLLPQLLLAAGGEDQAEPQGLAPVWVEG